MWGLQRQEKLKILAMAIHPTAQYPLREISRFCYESPDPHLLHLAPLQWTTVSNSSIQNPHSFCISYKDQQINTMSSLRFRPLCILEFFFFPVRSSIRMVVCLLLGDCEERQHFEFLPPSWLDGPQGHGERAYRITICFLNRIFLDITKKCHILVKIPLYFKKVLFFFCRRYTCQVCSAYIFLMSVLSFSFFLDSRINLLFAICPCDN